MYLKSSVTSFCLLAKQFRNVLIKSKRCLIVTQRSVSKTTLRNFHLQQKESSWVDLLYEDDEKSHSKIRELRQQLNAALVSKRNHEKGDLLPYLFAQDFVTHYNTLKTMEDKGRFFSLVAEKLRNDENSISESMGKLQEAFLQNSVKVQWHELDLVRSLIPPYKHLFDDISKLQNGIGFLVNMRKDFLMLFKKKMLPKSVQILSFDMYLKEHLAVWFAQGFLDLNVVSWENTSAQLLEKIKKYEAVHPINTWEELKKRAEPGRRIFSFSHRLMGSEPLVILHTLFSETIPDSIQTVLDGRGEDVVNEDDMTTAVFYSISSTQRGLDGIGLGNLLIKRVVELLRNEFGNMKTFVTLSPIPGFRKWLDFQFKFIEQSGEIPSILNGFHFDIHEVKNLLSCDTWYQDQNSLEILRKPLMQLCARYLICEKRRGFAIDPVAHFHLRNGASLWRLNWLGNTSARGLNASYGLMVNYLYDLSQIETNNNNYVTLGRIKYSELIDDLMVQRLFYDS